MTDATGTTTYAYDANGDLTSEALAADRHRAGQYHYHLRLLQHRRAGLGHLPGLHRFSSTPRSTTPTTPPGP